MIKLTPSPIPAVTSPDVIRMATGDTIKISGTVYKIRRASGIVFVMLTHHKYTYQAVYISELCKKDLREITEGAKITLTAKVKEEKRAEYGFELTMLDFDILALPKEELPIDITQPTLMCTLQENLDKRTATLYHPTTRAIMSITAELRRAFTQVMEANEFVSVTTPKITPLTADSEKEYIRVKYFDKNTALSKDSMIYLEMALPLFSRVYEISNCYSGINRNSTRHLNEYSALCFNMSYDCSINTLMTLTTNLIWEAINKLTKNCEDELGLLDVKLNPLCDIPVMTFTEAMKMLGVSESTGLDPTSEAKLWEYAKAEHGSDFIFITNLPRTGFTTKENENFALIYKGVTIATGMENTNSLSELMDNMDSYGINAEDYNAYIESYRYAMPPHGGVKIGIERFIYKLLELSNIREATMFIRDLHHIEP